jgi:hypothetical protein
MVGFDTSMIVEERAAVESLLDNIQTEDLGTEQT